MLFGPATLYTTGSLATGATLGDASRRGSVSSRINPKNWNSSVQRQNPSAVNSVGLNQPLRTSRHWHQAALVLTSS